MSKVEEDIRSAIALFESTESQVLPKMSYASLSIAAVGSVAQKALGSPLLRERLAEQEIGVQDYLPFMDLNELLENPDWSLALVLSPFKQSVRESCNTVTQVARRSGVIDTIVQGDSGERVGINTNSLGAAWTVKRLMGDSRPQRCLIAGTGASARSCVVGLRDLYGKQAIGVTGRNADRADQLASDFGISVVEDIDAYGPDLIINATTVGETADQEFHFPLEKSLVAGTRYFDLNNRVSALQSRALERGCVTLSGVLMQTIVNALRVHVLSQMRCD